MKIALINNFYIRNYGSVLQSFALYKKICNLGLDVVVVDYNDKPSMLNRIKGALILNRKAFVKKIISKIEKKNKPDCQFYKDRLKRNASFDEFAQKKYHFTKKYSNIFELTQDIRNFDAVLIGSDQLWAPSDILRNYHTLMWVPDSIKKVAYATSFGVAELPAILKKTTHNFLQRIDFISVREFSGKEIVKGLIGKDVPVVMDPTLLLEQSEWEKMIPNKRIVEGDYIFAFFLGGNVKYRHFVKQISKEKHLKIVSVLHVEEYLYVDNDFADVTYNYANPIDFINLIKNANYVFTDSFHVSIFSIINERRFFVFNRYDEMSTNSRNTRLISLLNKLGISERLVSVENIIDVDSPIDYSSVNQKIKEWRVQSDNYLNSALKY